LPAGPAAALSRSAKEDKAVESRIEVNGLPLPALLLALLREDRWRHPGEAPLRRIIPFLVAPIDFLTSPEEMAFESSGHLADNPQLSTKFHEVRGRQAGEPVELPWRDVDRSLFVAINRFPGDDIGVALDYRTSVDNPRVIANDWGSGQECVWREVAPTFSSFVSALGLGSQSA
jgi:hypothetical protein